MMTATLPLYQNKANKKAVIVEALKTVFASEGNYDSEKVLIVARKMIEAYPVEQQITIKKSDIFRASYIYRRDLNPKKKILPETTPEIPQISIASITPMLLSAQNLLTICHNDAKQAKELIDLMALVTPKQ